MSDIDWKKIEKATLPYRVENEPIIIRFDGNGFSQFSRKYFERPLDIRFSQAMIHTARRILLDTQGAVLAFTQSDEINLLLKPKAEGSQIAYGGKTQKLLSILAARVSLLFNSATPDHVPKDRVFDARIIRPALAGVDIIDAVKNYYRHRFFNGITNSRNMFAGYYLSQSEIDRTPSKKRIELAAKKGYNWYDLEEPLRYGWVVYKSADDVKEFSPITFKELERAIIEVFGGDEE